MAYSEEQRNAARQELARRELARRQQPNEVLSEEEDIPYTPPPERKGWGGVWEDVKDIPEKILDYGIELPGKAAESWMQIGTQPGRAIKNLIAGAGETLEAPVNLLGAVGPYLKERGITNKIPGFEVPNTGIEKIMGLEEQQPGDELIRQMFMFAGVPKLFGKIPGVKNVGERVKNLSQHAPLTNKLEKLENKLETAKTEHIAASDEYNALKNFLESQPGFESSNPHALQRKAVEAQQKLGVLREQTQDLPEHLKALEEPIAPEKKLLSLVEPIRAGEKPTISDEAIREAESVFKTNEQKSAELEEKFGQGHLRRGYTHDVPIAEGVVNKIKERKKDIGEIYDSVERDLEEKHVLIPHTEQLSEAEKSVRTLLKDSRDFFKSDEEFEAAVQKLAKADKNAKNHVPNDIIPAADVLKNYRTVRHLGQKLRSEAYTSKVASNKDLQADMLAKADEFEKTANNLERQLEENDLGGSLETLKTANKRWREEVTPLYKNKTYRQFLTGLGPDNIMKALRGSGPGQEIIRKIIKSDPLLLRNIVGQRYANNPAKLHEFDQLTHEYSQHMPEVQEFKQQHFESKEAISKAKMAVERAKHEHQLQRENADIAHRKATEKAAEETRAKKAEINQENIIKQKEHQEKAQEFKMHQEAKIKHFKMQQEIKLLEEKSEKLSDSAAKLLEKSKREDISLKKKLDIEHERAQVKKQLSKIEKDIHIKRKALRIASGIAITGIIGGPIYEKAKSVIGGT